MLHLAPPGTGHGPAVLDDAHVGDIRGALGTLRVSDTAARRGPRARLLTLFAIMGPGLIVMVGDNDAGGVATYSQAGQNYGTSLLWTLPLLLPVLIVNQEMVVRLGAVTGVGHARLINERFGRFWGIFSVGDLFLLNFLTIVTEFIGVSLAGSYFGLSPYVSVPLAAAVLIGITVTGNFRRWERFMFVFLGTSLLILPLGMMSHTAFGDTLHGLAVPRVRGGVTSDAVLLIIAIVGTTVAPWQLFFQQSIVVDKRITPRWLGYARLDTVIGALIVVVGAVILMMASAHAFGGTPDQGGFSDAGGTAAGLASYIGRGAGALFALVLLDAAIIGASAVTLATSYAFGDMFGMRHSLHRTWRDAKGFYGSYAALVSVAAVIVILPNAPLGLLTTAVQALAGVLLPSATMFLLLLCNDKEVLGPWVNKAWLNAVAAVIIGVLLELSAILTISTLIPGVDASKLFVGLSGVLIVALLGAGTYVLIGMRRRERVIEEPVDKLSWRMPPLAFLQRPVWSRRRSVGMLAMRGYLLVAMLLLIVKAVELATGH